MKDSIKEHNENAYEARLTARIDNLDPHMDSELADDALQYLKRQHAIKVLTDQYNSHTNDVGMAFNEHDRLKTLLGTLKAEQAAYEAKNEALGPNDFDGSAWLRWGLEFISKSI